MLRYFSEQFVTLLINKDAIERERKAVYIYGCELLLSTGCSIISVLVIGILTRHLLQALIFILFFMPIRTVANGYHADSYEKCFLLTNLIACLCMYADWWIYESVPIWLVWLIYLLSHIFIWIRGPFQSKKNPLKKERVEKNRHYMHRIQLVELVVALLFTVMLYQTLLYPIIVTTFVVALMIFIAEKSN